jgi:hypothetical protein
MTERRDVMTSRHRRFRLPAFLLLVGIGFLFVWGCGDDTPTGPGREDPTRITMQLTAIVSTVNDPSSVLAGVIEVADTISGTYTYDSTIGDSYPADTAIGEYSHSSAPYGIFLQIKGYEFKTDLNDVDFMIVIANDFDMMGPSIDLYGIISYNNGPVTFNVALDGISWMLADDTATALSGDELTTSPLDLADWAEQVLTIEGHSISQPSQMFNISGVVSEISKVQ